MPDLRRVGGPAAAVAGAQQGDGATAPVSGAGPTEAPCPKPLIPEQRQRTLAPVGRGVVSKQQHPHTLLLTDSIESRRVTKPVFRVKHFPAGNCVFEKL